MPLQEKAYLELKKMIDTGELKLGTVYSETKISQMLNISRTPFRSALNRMAQDGCIDILPSRGFILHEMTQSEFLDYIDMLCALEDYAIRCCSLDSAKRADLLGKLKGIHAQMQSGNDARFHDLNNQFHATVIQANRNIVINRNYHNMKYLMATQYATKCFDEADRERILDDHRRLMEMIAEGATDAASALTAAHLRFEMDARDLKEAESAGRRARRR